MHVHMPCRGGLHCHAVRVSIPEVAVALSPRLLALMARAQASACASKALKPNRARRKSPADVAAIAALLPDEVRHPDASKEQLHAAV